MKFFYIDENTVSISLNETTSITDLNKIITVFADAKGLRQQLLKVYLQRIIFQKIYF
jgi:glycine dehydrogenase